MIIAEGEDWINNELIFSELQHKKRTQNNNKVLNMNMNQLLGFANANHAINEQKSNINLNQSQNSESLNTNMHNMNMNSMRQNK